MKKTIAIILALLFLAPATAVAASDKFSDSQTTLSYSVYKPSNTLGLKTSKFSLLQCLPDEQDWLFVQYGGTVRYKASKPAPDTLICHRLSVQNS